MPNILVTGADGQLGSEIKSLVDSKNFYFANRKIVDIQNQKALKDFLHDNKIEVIVNCAAYTAVDKAEVEQSLANEINHVAVKNLSVISKERNIKLIHISTDYVYEGTNYKPYKEDDITNPQGVYGKTKLDGERAMLKIAPANSIIIRTSWLYSSYGSNFVKTMLKLGQEKDELGVIYDQIGSPTYAKDLAKTILEIVPKIKNSTPKIYHYSNEGVLSWYDFAKEIMRLAKLSCKINPIETYEYPTPAKRPYYSVLNKSKIKKDFGIRVPYWKDSLFDCIDKIMSDGL